MYGMEPKYTKKALKILNNFSQIYSTNLNIFLMLKLLILNANK